MASTADSPRRQTLAGRLCAGLLISPIVTGLLVSIAVAKYSGGSGSAADPYQIGTPEDVNTLGNTPDDWNKQFVLVKDIDLTGYTEKNLHLIGRWVAFGATENKPFTGIFDGKGRTISNLRFRDANSQGSVGLFPCVNNGEVRNLKLNNVKIVGNGTSTGSLAGTVGEAGAVVNCHATGIDVTGNTRVGGLVGSVDGAVAQCSSLGRVTGVRYVGGLVGEVDEGTIARSYSRATVSGDESVGGLAGATVNQVSVINSCYATGKVHGAVDAGGLVGLVARGRVFRSYSAGVVTGDRNVGGLIGEMMFLGEEIASFWDKEASGQTTSGGGTGKTTAEMRSADTYTNWDFYLTWAICEGLHTPVFLWQIPLGDLRCPDGVTTLDFAWFALQWQRVDCGAVNASCEWADLDESGDVGYRDLAIFAENWLTGID